MAWGPAAPGSCPPSYLGPPMPAGTWGVMPEASRSWQRLFRLAQPLPRASQVQAPDLAWVSSGRGGGTGSSSAQSCRGVTGDRAGPSFRKEPSPSAAHPDLLLHWPQESEQGPRPGPAVAAPEASWALHTSKGLELDSTEGHLGDSPGAGGGAEGRDPSHGGSCPPATSASQVCLSPSLRLPPHPEPPSAPGRHEGCIPPLPPLPSTPCSPPFPCSQRSFSSAPCNPLHSRACSGLFSRGSVWKLGELPLRAGIGTCTLTLNLHTAF